MKRYLNSSTLRYFSLWLAIVPIGLIYTYSQFPPKQIDWINLGIFSLVGFLSIYFPIQRKGKPTFLVMWVTVPVFLMYGVIAEIIVMQIAIIATLFVTKSNLNLLKRLFINSTLFFLLSYFAAVAFRAVGSEVGSMDFWQMTLGVLVYQVTHTILNDVILKVYGTYKRIRILDGYKETLMEYTIIVVSIPLALSLYFLLQLIGISAFLLLGAPYFFITFLIKLYENTERINNSLRLAGDIGSQLSVLQTEKEVIDQFVLQATEMFNADFAYLFDYNNEWLELIRSCERGQLVSIDFQPLASGQGLAGSVLLKNEPIIYSSRTEWEQYSKNYTPDEMESVLCVPITRNQRIEAVLLLGSKKKLAFKEYQLKILDLLCSYFTVSVEKSRYMEETVAMSERCALTKLYNYRYLEEKLNLDIERLKRRHIHSLSVVMLDIDHFKKVNDTYGHECGNEILRKLAVELQKEVPQGSIVGRYGGEEFVYILPNIQKEEAAKFAEILRLRISEMSFEIIPDLFEDKSPINIKITTSFGVSSAPEDTDEAMNLLRNADRALYIGAKQAGRNRVAEYVK